MLVEEEKSRQESRDGNGEGLEEPKLDRGCCCRRSCGREVGDDDVNQMGLNFEQPALLQSGQLMERSPFDCMGLDSASDDGLDRGGSGRPKSSKQPYLK